MAKDASRALGAPQLAGSIVNARTVARKLTRGSAETIAEAPSDRAPELPHFGRVGFLAVTHDEIAIVDTRNHALWTKVGDRVLARVPRSAITRVELDSGLLSHLTIGFDNAVVWELDVPRLNRNTAEEVVHELGRSS
jgi:hypothetical protein